MTKHTAFAADDAIAAAFTSAPAAAQPGRRFMSYPPRMARGGCRVAAAARQATDPGAAGVAAGSWPELVPRHADFDDWMVRLPFDHMPRLLCLRSVRSSPPDLT